MQGRDWDTNLQVLKDSAKPARSQVYRKIDITLLIKEDAMSTQSAKLAADVKILIHDAEELVKATAAETGDKVIGLRRRMQQTVNDVKPTIEKLESAVIDKVKPTATAADQYVHTHPWQAIGASAIVGLIIGLLANRH